MAVHIYLRGVAGLVGEDNTTYLRIALVSFYYQAVGVHETYKNHRSGAWLIPETVTHLFKSEVIIQLITVLYSNFQGINYKSAFETTKSNGHVKCQPGGFKFFGITFVQLSMECGWGCKYDGY